jgi:copper chaperone NosL
MPDKLGNISKGNLAALLCSVTMMVVFLFLSWFTVLDGPISVGKTGIHFLVNGQANLQGYLSAMWLIPLAAGVGGLAGLWGLLDVSARGISRIVACLAGGIGLFYYGRFVIQNDQDLMNMIDLVGPGFWVGLLASIGLILQITISPRPIRPSKEELSQLLPSVFWGGAAVLLGVSTFLVYWQLHLDAPQYNIMDGLDVVVYFNRMESGDPDFDALHELNSLNHYIGMKPLDEAAEIERTIAPYAIVIFAVSLLVAAVWKHKWSWLLTIPPLTFPFVFLGDLAFWLNNFGQNLDPTAAFSSAIHPFTPPALGYGEIGQFETMATLEEGWILAATCSLLIAAGLIVRFIDSRKQQVEPVARPEQIAQVEWAKQTEVG